MVFVSSPFAMAWLCLHRYTAINRNHKEVVRMLAESKADVNQATTDDDATPL